MLSGICCCRRLVSSYLVCSCAFDLCIFSADSSVDKLKPCPSSPPRGDVFPSYDQQDRNSSPGSDEDSLARGEEEEDYGGEFDMSHQRRMQAEFEEDCRQQAPIDPRQNIAVTSEYRKATSFCVRFIYANYARPYLVV